MELSEKIGALETEMLEKIGRLVRYDSVRGDALPGKPFGEGPAAALKEALNIAEELGFRVKNLDNYCGYAEMGEGSELIGIAGHLDIVPAGDGWTHDPFVLSREGDKVFGRGTTDDKGPCIEALYAMKLLRDEGFPMKKRVRLIFGCNEETGSLCMRHYNEVEEPLTAGFTPDANFPCIHGEKGTAGLLIESGKTAILSMDGGFVGNAVCDRCTTVLPGGSLDLEALKKALADTPLTSFDVRTEEGKITVYAEGKAAHASLPLLGVNAASYTMLALKNAGFKDEFVDFYVDRIGTSCDGKGCGIDFKDDYGVLTFNNGIVRTENGVIRCMIDIRVPVTVTEEQFRAAIAPALEDPRGTIRVLYLGKSLFHEKDSPLIRALYKAYVDVTGDTAHEPEVIGGGTYAKSLPGIVAFGPEMPGMDYHIHTADEFILVSGMKEATEIYYHAIRNLLEA